MGAPCVIPVGRVLVQARKPRSAPKKGGGQAARPTALPSLFGYNLSVSTYRFTAVIEKDADGYFAFCPELQGCYSQGDTYEEALANLRDAIRLHVEDRLESGDEIPIPENISFTPVELTL